MQLHSTTGDELRAIAHDFARALRPGAQATVVALSGDLGAGKTTFAQGVAQALGVGETVQSPTFVIEKVYQLDAQPFACLIHIDAYRLKGPRELDILGWKELLAEPRTLILIEWPEMVPGALPDGAIRIRFDIDGEGRRITIDGHEEGSQKDS